MSEKVIHEVRVVETDDGYRIEVKGDKEHIKQRFGKMSFGPGMMFMRGRGRRGGFGPGFRRGFGPHWWGEEEDAPPAGV